MSSGRASVQVEARASTWGEAEQASASISRCLITDALAAGPTAAADSVAALTATATMMVTVVTTVTVMRRAATLHMTTAAPGAGRARTWAVTPIATCSHRKTTRRTGPLRMLWCGYIPGGPRLSVVVLPKAHLRSAIMSELWDNRAFIDLRGGASSATQFQW